jgi:hypothetical protein
MKTGKRILVVYYSRSGHTARVAEDLATRLGADREGLRDRKSRRGLLGYLSAVYDSMHERPAELTGLDKRPEDYALTLIGTPIWAGNITPAVRAYLQANHGKFNEVAFFTTSGMTPVQKVIPTLEKLAGRTAIASLGFNGGDMGAGESYEQKITAFLGTLRNEPSIPLGAEPAHAAG